MMTDSSLPEHPLPLLRTQTTSGVWVLPPTLLPSTLLTRRVCCASSIIRNATAAWVTSPAPRGDIRLRGDCLVYQIGNQPWQGSQLLLGERVRHRSVHRRKENHREK